MPLSDALARDEFPRSGTIQQNWDFLHVEVTVEDHNLYSVAQVAVVLDRDEDKLRYFTGSLKNFSNLDPNVWAFSFKVNGVGQDFADPAIQGMIDKMAAEDEWPDEVRDKVKAIGVKTMDRWEMPELGIPTDPTLEEVAAVMEPRRILEVLEGVKQQVEQGAFTTTDAVAGHLETVLPQVKTSLGV